MLTADARLETDRASRYLVQLCDHIDQVHGRHDGPQLHADAMPRPQRVERSDTHGEVSFDRGRCTLDATADSLTLRVEATDIESLQRIQQMVTQRLETIGRRDNLTLIW